MGIFMGTTQISAERTVGQVQELLARNNASQVLTEYETGQVSAVSFTMVIAGRQIPFRLPCRYKAIASQIDQKPREDGEEYEKRLRRIAWRQLYRWIEAQCALIETGMVATEEVFMPYIQGRNGQTLFENFQKNTQAMLGYDKKSNPESK